MRASWTLDRVRAVTGGRWLGERPRGAEAPTAGFSTDTRTLRADEVFLALRGARFDGGRFAREALQKGAAGVVVEPDAARALGVGAGVVVDDARRALVAIGAEHRRGLARPRVVGVTGSNGKTTTVRLLEAALSVTMRGVASEKSFNNDVGLPLTLLRARDEDDYLICEVGMNAPGEMAPLCEALRPDVAIVTSVGRAHVGAFADAEAIGREKAQLIRALGGKGIAIVGHGAPGLSEALAGARAVRRVGFEEEADVIVRHARHVERTDGSIGVAFELGDGATFELPMLGRHNAVNAAIAITAARSLGAQDEDIRTGISCRCAAEMRLGRRLVGGAWITNDAYNSNPDSFAAAVETFLDIERDAARRIVVFGAMLELGAHSAALHEEAARLLVRREGVDRVVVVGARAAPARAVLEGALGAARVSSFESMTDEAAREIAATIESGDAALLKGSRGIGLERIERALEARLGARDPAAAARGG